MSRSVRTIEATGKRWKGLQALSAVACGVGFWWAYLAQKQEPATLPWAVGLATGGLVMFLIARALAWWYHG